MYKDGYGRIRKVLASATDEARESAQKGARELAPGCGVETRRGMARMRQGITRGTPPTGQALAGR